MESILSTHEPKRVMEMLSIRLLCIEEHCDEFLCFLKSKIAIQEFIAKKKGIYKNSSQNIGSLGLVFQKLIQPEKDISFELKEIEIHVVGFKKESDSQIKEFKKTEQHYLKIWKKLPTDKSIIDTIIKQNDLQTELDKKQKKILLLWEEWIKHVKRCIEILDSIEKRKFVVFKECYLKLCTSLKDQLSPILDSIASSIIEIQEYTYEKDKADFMDLNYSKFGICHLCRSINTIKEEF